MDPNGGETDHAFSQSDQDISSNQSDQDTTSGVPTRDTICSDIQLATSTHKADTGSNDFCLPRFFCASNEVSHLSLTTVKANDHDQVLGRKLFEEDKKSRSSLITKLQEDLKKKEALRNIYPFQDSEGSSNETSGDEVSSVGELVQKAHHSEAEEQESTICGKERAKVLEESNEEQEEHCAGSYQDTQVSDKKETPDVLDMTRGKNKRKYLMFSGTVNPMNDTTLQKATNENQNETIETAAVNTLPKAGAANAMLKEATGTCQSEYQTASSNHTQIHHGKLSDLEMGHRETAQGEGVDVKYPKVNPNVRNRTGDNMESMPPKNKGISQSKLGAKLHATVDKRYKQHFQEKDDVLRDENSASTQTAAKKKENEKNELFHTDDVPNKYTIETSVRSPFLEGNVVADGCTTDAFPQTTEDVVNGPALTSENHLSGCFSTIEGMNCKEDKTFNSKRSVDNVKRIEELDMIMNHPHGDVVDGPIKSPKDDIKFSRISPDFGGARPKQGFPKATETSSASTCIMDPRSTQQFKENLLGLDPYFVARHAVANSFPTSSFQNLNLNGATCKDPREDAFDEHYFSALACSGVNRRWNLSICRRFPEDGAFAAGGSIQDSGDSRIVYQSTPSKQDESWHFPPLPANTENYVPPRNFPPSHFYNNQQCATQQNLTEVHEPLFDQPMSRSAYNDRVSMKTEFNYTRSSHGETQVYSPNNNEVDAVSQGQQDSSEHYTESLLENLKNTMTRTVRLVASTEKQAKPEQKPVEKVGIQEQASGEEENEHAATAREKNLTEQETPLPRNERTVDMEREDRTTPVQESPRPACVHYQRRCLVKFPCCGRFYPCHRCHNESKACSDDQARAINATHIRCTICYHEQLVRCPTVKPVLGGTLAEYRFVLQSIRKGNLRTQAAGVRLIEGVRRLIWGTLNTGFINSKFPK